MADADRRKPGADERDTDRGPFDEAGRDSEAGRTGNPPRPQEDRNVLSNAVQRTDNAFNGIENDESLIGTDIGDEEDEDLDEIDRERAGPESLDDAVRNPDR